jgi:hypothetical protein
MKLQLAVVVLALALGFGGCASSKNPGSSPAHSDGKTSRAAATAPCFQPREIQCEVTGLHTLASETPDYLSALRGEWDPAGTESVLARH